MKKVIFALAGAASIVLTGCGTQNALNETGSAVMGTGARVVSTTGTVVQKSGTVVVKGTRVVVGGVASATDRVIFQKKGVVYRDGHAYHIENGRYVAAD
ncbi:MULTISPECIES: hypothetical protein [Legionella]|uniref:Lipoprotein n=1 Tax=Legionella quinlivanii TaxID=45073 RepID=A0A364LMY7_9GAMM|nr:MULTISPECIES: hypothetical protein [Legionella]MCE3044729.1 hypothetical protein [Legionella sp. 16cNR16C]RAP38424.1 hypothetical protein B1207_00605 [Legionella quinlivanii]